MKEKKEDAQKRYAKLVAKAWSDESFRQRLMSDTGAVLKEAGFDVPEGKQIRVLETDMNSTVYFFLPPKPAGAFSESDMQQQLIPSVCCSMCGSCIPMCFCWD